jgi:hypothetical protein
MTLPSDSLVAFMVLNQASGSKTTSSGTHRHARHEHGRRHSAERRPSSEPEAGYVPGQLLPEQELSRGSSSRRPGTEEEQGRYTPPLPPGPDAPIDLSGIGLDHLKDLLGMLVPPAVPPLPPKSS